jgi:sigma-B regulation protein RsbU (phosphoserine phosphatase)
MTRILIVEDEPDIVLGLQRDLSLDGYSVEAVGDGDGAIASASRGAIDLILLDVGLPGKDGFAVCRELRHRGIQTPIIVLTARGDEAQKVQGLELGADDYVTKPFSPAELRARIRSILRHRDEWLGESVKLDRELRTAAEVQQRLLPQAELPVTGLDYVGYCQPALRVGGDYYDYLDLSGGRLGLVLADVAGKGASAALLMASLHGCIRSHASRHQEGCAHVVRLANDLLHKATDAGRYATMFYGVFDGATRTLLYINAGHPAPIIARDAEILPLASHCPPIGLFDELAAETQSIQLQPGDRLLIFSDGLSEAMNEQNDEFGSARLTRVLRDSCAHSAAAVRDDVLRHLRAHTGGCPQSDDVTFIAGVVR